MQKKHNEKYFYSKMIGNYKNPLKQIVVQLGPPSQNIMFRYNIYKKDKFDHNLQRNNTQLF